MAKMRGWNSEEMLMQEWNSEVCQEAIVKDFLNIDK